MAKPGDVLDYSAFDRVAKLRLIARTVVDSFTAGQHRSAYKGFSVEFSQHRGYARGDELRHIDWKVYGKSDRLVVKQYEEETNLRATICLDASGSMAYGKKMGGAESKFEYARKVAAAMAYLMIKQTDATGLVTFDSETREWVPPRSTKAHLSTLLQVMVDTQPGQETNLAHILHRISERLKRRGLVIVISDFFAPLEDLVQAFAHLHHKRHEAILIQVLDPDEITFPFDQVAEFRNLERSQHKVKLDAPRVRQLYLERFNAFLRGLREACHRLHYDHLVLATDQPFDAALSHYLGRRMGR